MIQSEPWIIPEISAIIRDSLAAAPINADLHNYKLWFVKLRGIRSI